MPARHIQRLFTIDGSTNTATESNRTRPDILIVLEESTFDATLIGDCSADECDVAMLHPLNIATRTQQGPLMVHSTGGGTWLSEFAFMSGFDWRLFGRGGAYAPVSLAPRLQQALPARLRALGYRTVAVCPTGGNFLSAQTAYQYYGFDEFYSAQDLKLDDDWTEIYDHTMFDNALKIALRNNDPRPVFVFVLTIRNHGPHGDGAVDLPDNLVQAKQKYGAEIADYLGRMRDSSDDFVHVASTWLKSDRPRVIGWFGDHQPEAAWDITRHPERLQRNHIASNATEGQIQYLTHYQLSANFGEHEQRVSQEAMDISYLGSQLLSFAGLPLTPSNNAAKETADKCHGLMISCANHELVNAYVSYRIHELREIN
jgi:phosphoglycerol transferase MdoB-like AlkP superfamily enzyme